MRRGHWTSGLHAQSIKPVDASNSVKMKQRGQITSTVISFQSFQFLNIMLICSCKNIHLHAHKIQLYTERGSEDTMYHVEFVGTNPECVFPV